MFDENVNVVDGNDHDGRQVMIIAHIAYGRVS